jgi:hypothetical protein
MAAPLATAKAPVTWLGRLISSVSDFDVAIKIDAISIHSPR